MRPIALLLLATCLAPLERVAAQDAALRVRFTIASPTPRRLVGTLVSQDTDSLWVQVAGQAAPMAVARSAVGVEVSQGRRRAIAEGARIGAQLGVLGGVVVGLTTAQSQACGTSDLVGMCSLASYARGLEGALIGGTIGAVVGAALGSAVRTDRWEAVSLGPSRHLALAPRGAGVAVSLTF